MIPFKGQKLTGNLTCKEVHKMQHLREFSIASKSHKGHRSAYYDMIHWISDCGNNSHTLHTLKFLIRKKRQRKLLRKLGQKIYKKTILTSRKDYTVTQLNILISMQKVANGTPMKATALSNYMIGCAIRYQYK